MSVVIEKSNLKITSIEVPESHSLKSVNFYLVEKNNQLFLIDAGINKESYWEYLKTSFQENGYEWSDLTAILLTHHHGDHVGLVRRITEIYDVPVYVHPYALPILKRDPKFIYMNYLFFKDLFIKFGAGDFGNQYLKEKYEQQMKNPLSALGSDFHTIQEDSIFDFEVIPIPGHALDQVAFYLREEDIIFVGDLLINHLRTNAFIEPDLNGNKNNALQQHRESLKKIITLNPKLALSGHGSIIKEPAKLAKRRLEAIDEKADSFISLIQAGITTGNGIVKERHPNKYKKIFSIVMSDALSFLEYLEMDGHIQKEEIEGVWHYSLPLS